ncbi:MAG: MBL fold metallo-hydrolase [bacterium]|nr:MBL fold metallo-hydrolase [bacterium]
MKLSFFGACRMVTGSCYLLEHEGSKLLIDCGMIQGAHFSEKDNLAPFPFDPKDVDYIAITHAHVDHCGRVPKLVKEGFNGEIVATHATLSFIELMLGDSVHVIQSEAEEHGHEPLYDEEDVISTVQKFQGVEYHQKISLGPFSLEFYDAGHILGSSSIYITAGGKTIVFSGDIGNPPVPLLKETEYLEQVDYVVMESTYGARKHEASRDRSLLLKSAIYETITMGGVLLIPAFSLERTQEVLYELNSLVENEDIPKVPIFVDSPLAIKATRLYPKYNHLFNKEAKYLLDSGDDLFDFPGLQMTETVKDSIKINNVKAPKIIMAASGMMQGGRIRHHLKRYLSDYKTQILIIGYQVEGSLGRKLLDGEKVVVIEKQEYTVKAKIRPIGAYSAHADKDQLMKWLTHNKPEISKIWLTHGEEAGALELADTITKTLGVITDVPEYGQEVEL